jgi:hypothetical protein
MAVAAFMVLWSIILIAYLIMRWRMKHRPPATHRNLGDPETDLNIRALIDHIHKN